MFAHLGFIKENGEGWRVDKGQQIRMQNTAAETVQADLIIMLLFVC